MPAGVRVERLRVGLEALYGRYHRSFLSPDPLEFPHRFRRSEDREVVGLIASGLAYGNVRSICNSMEKVLEWIGPSPSRFVQSLNPRHELERLGSFQHRWTRARDVVCLSWFAHQMIDMEGSIGGFFAKGHDPGDLAASLRSFSNRALELDHGGLYAGSRVGARDGVRYFFTSPGTGACKRLNMYLRWMVRPDDGLDFGLWTFMSPRELVIPLDTHIFRIGNHFRWTRRKTQNWVAAAEITKALAAANPADPVKYDFALSRLGIHANCPRHPRTTQCELCELRRTVFARRKGTSH